jgi:AcrR family transcriptional regulator
MTLTPQQPGKARRRRGATLEAALLEAAWDELMAVGYASLTMEGVATRAHANKTVIYRRWSTRRELVMAALRHHKTGKEVPNTGSLRGDVLALLRAISERNVELAGLISVLQADYYQETGLPPVALRERTPGGASEIMESLLRRAVDRGEIDAGRITPRIARLPIDLVHHDLTMTLAPMTEAALEEIVDTIFLPLLRR